MYSLAENPQPTVTVAPRLIPIPHAAAFYTLAFSITMGSTATSADYLRGLRLNPASITSPKSTNTTSLQPQVAIVRPTSWLESTIDALLASVPDEEWAKVPDRYVANIDKRM